MDIKIADVLREPETIALAKAMEELTDSITPIKWDLKVSNQLERLNKIQVELLPELIRAELIKDGSISNSGAIIPLEQRFDEQLCSIRTRFRNVYEYVLKELGDNIQRKEEH